jgi:hypothetical protein
MPFEFNLLQIQEYGTRQRKHGAYDKSVEMYCALKVHANGEVPIRLICERRPGESERIKDYRVCIYEPVTKAPVSRVISSLSKIRRSPDWSIKFDITEIRAIAENESLENYLLENYPKDQISFTNWMFGIGLKEYLLDSNAVVLVKPLVWDIAQNEYYKPYPFIFNSPQVLDYESDMYAVLLSDEKCSYNVVDEKGNILGKKTDGDIIITVDDMNIDTYYQTDQYKRFILVDRKVHNLGFFPVFKMPGIFFEICNAVAIKESRINGMIPDLNEAARIYSDLQAEVVQHIHSDRWEIMNTRCTHCNGSGQLIQENQDPCACTHCKGVGYVPTSPYTVRVLTPPQIGEEPIPTPPAGYIQKTDVAEMCDRLDQRVEKHKYYALAAVNMQNLAEVPLNQSGTAKEVDRDEQSNFVHAVAEDIVCIMDRIAFITNEYRNSIAVPDKELRKTLLPTIAVPERFDLFSVDTLAKDVNNAKEQKLNNFIVATLETEYANKKFYAQPEIARLVQLSYNLDPLTGLSEDEKISRLQNDGVAAIDYIISSNLIPFLKRALREDKNFEKKGEDEQLAVLTGYAIEKQQQITAAGRVTQALTDEVVPATEPDNTIAE